MAIAKLNFKGYGKKYEYSFQYPENPTLEKIAWNLSRAMGEAEKRKKTKFYGQPHHYNLILKLLKESKINIHAPSESLNMEQMQFEDATIRNQSEKVEKIPCCTNPECQKCNGHGFVYQRQMWRVGVTQNHTLVIDIDGKDLENAKKVKFFYENILDCTFKIISTNGGYWLISNKKYNSVDDWKFDHCRVLNPFLLRERYNGYVKTLCSLDRDEKGNFKKCELEDIKKAGLYFGYGTFDFAFTFLSIRRGISTLRLSKKRKNEKIELIN